MNELQKEKEIINQHKADAQKALENLKTQGCNISGGKIDWDVIVKVREEYINAFIESLVVREKQFEHFK